MMIKPLQSAARSLSTMAVSGYSTAIYEIHSEEDLQSLILGEQPFYVLGEGSNTIFVDEDTPIIIRPLLKGIVVNESTDCFELVVGAGENWHQLVYSTIYNDMPGLENLALIPGSVGAAPVQNIGAYGVEFSKFCVAVNWFCFTDKEIKTLLKADCQFGYRDSIFKHSLKGKGLITSVILSLPKQWQPILDYGELNKLPKSVTPTQLMTKVIDIRHRKLPDPIKLANAGSFFKNPIVNQHTYNRLTECYPAMPFYLQDNGRVKLAAGWLIEQSGLKGYRQGDAGVHEKQALVIVNYGNASGMDILNLAKHIINVVADKFGIKLVPEVRLVTSAGEKTMTELNQYV